MEYSETSTFCDAHKNVSTQTSDDEVCAGANQDICGLCGKRGLSESDEIAIGGSLPDNVCQCFFFSNNNAPEANFAVEQETEAESPTTEVCNSPDVNLRPVIEVSYVESSNISIKDYVNSSEGSNIPELSLSSNSIDKLSHVQNLASCSSIPSPRFDKNYRTSPNTERGNISSGYALSLDQSSDQINFTSPSSGEDSRISSHKETSPSSGYAMSMGEQSFDRNFRNLTTSSSAEEPKSSPDVDKAKHCVADLSKSNTDSKLKNKTEYRSRQTSPSEQGHRNIKQLRAGEPINSQSMLKAVNDNLKHNIKAEYRGSQSSPNEQGYRNHQQIAEEANISRSMERDVSNKAEQYEKDNISQGIFRLENQNIRFATIRPPLPRPFPNCYQPHQLDMNPALNTPASTLPQSYAISAMQMPAVTTHQPFMNTAVNVTVQMHQQPCINPPMRILAPTLHQPFINAAINMPVPTTYSASYPQQYLRTFNMPIIPTNIPGRFPIAPRPQASTSYHRPNSEGSGSLSKKSLQEVDRMNLGGRIINKEESIDSWIESVNYSIKSGEGSLPPEWDQSSSAENEANARQFPGGPGFQETTTDERSSTEKSEEENRRQRSLRRPPRSRRK